MTALEELVSLMFPAGLLDYFVITRVLKMATEYNAEYVQEWLQRHTSVANLISA